MLWVSDGKPGVTRLEPSQAMVSARAGRKEPAGCGGAPLAAAAEAAAASSPIPFQK